MQKASVICLTLIFYFGFQPFNMYGQTPSLSIQKPQAIELGQVQWLRDFRQATIQAAKVQKPIFILFQEVPGCATCRNYGQNVLSHPLIAETIETLFVPLAIHNNKDGADAKVLQSFGEPAWNNPVVRIVDTQKKDLVPRVSGNYSRLGVVQAMVLSLKKAGLKVPDYLKLLEEEWLAEKQGTETATFAMYCFWTGEKKLGKLNGIVETQAGFMNGREVVQVEYNPAVTSYEILLSQAQKSSCASHVYVENQTQQKLAEQAVGKMQISATSKFRLDNEPKYYLSKTIYKYVPMTQLQAAKVNSKIGNMELPDSLLSPRQNALAEYIRANPNQKWKNAVNEELTVVWNQITPWY